ncbi:hypothetical protein BASA81_002502 [Batrachochytrium salamandrivorans]|nr:hypothetical protein BASA81_002502 [Batrachochytrium salamandrivorans]
MSAVPTAMVWWRRKKRGGLAAADVATANSRAKLERNRNESFVKAKAFDTLEGRSAQVIQKWVRGYLLRRDLKLVALESALSGPSIRLCIDLVLDWYQGWLAQLLSLFLLVLAMLTLGLQMFSDSPTAYVEDSSLFRYFSQSAAQALREQVVQSQDLYQFMISMIALLSTTGDVPAPSPQCSLALGLLCPLNTSLSYDDIIASIQSTCPNISTNSGYLDNTHRIVGTMYVTQTRRKPVPCEDRMEQVDPYRGLGRMCLSETEEDTEFLPQPSSPSLPQQIEILPEYGFFAHALTGSAFNLPDSFAQCRVEELQAQYWLDHRTKRICFWVTSIDMSGGGRLLAYSECFEFQLGGGVVNDRKLVSMSFRAQTYQNSVTLGFTILSICMLCIRLIWLAYTLMQDWGSLGFWLRVTGTVLELTANIMYLQFAARMSQFEFDPPMEEMVFFNDPYAYLPTVFTTFDLAEFWTTYSILASLGLFFLMASTIAGLEFHPSSSLVGGIIKQAALRLSVFLFVCVVFICAYALIGMALFNRTFARFGNYGNAINTLLLVMIGSQSILDDEIINPPNQAKVSPIQNLYFWVFIALTRWMLLLVLQSLIVEAWANMSESARANGVMLSLWRSLVESLYLFGRQIKSNLRRVFCCPEERLETPLEMLLRLRKQARGYGISAKELRPELQQVFYSSRTVELVILRCRKLTLQQKFQPKAKFLRGLEANSAAMRGHQIHLIE